MESNYKHSGITAAIIGAFYAVCNTLEYGFLEKAYENSLAFELRETGLEVKQQAPLKVRYSRYRGIGKCGWRICS